MLLPTVGIIGMCFIGYLVITKIYLLSFESSELKKLQYELLLTKDVLKVTGSFLISELSARFTIINPSTDADQASNIAYLHNVWRCLVIINKLLDDDKQITIPDNLIKIAEENKFLDI